MIDAGADQRAVYGGSRFSQSPSARFCTRRVHVVPQFVGGEPELGFEADVGGGILGTV